MRRLRLSAVAAATTSAGGTQAVADSEVSTAAKTVRLISFRVADSAAATTAEQPVGYFAVRPDDPTCRQSGVDALAHLVLRL